MRASGASTPLANLDREEEIETLAVGMGAESAFATTALLQRTLDLIDRNVNARLAMDVLLLDLPSLMNGLRP
jgi:hypothetical protein